jgi:hypothetical protein
MELLVSDPGREIPAGERTCANRRVCILVRTKERNKAPELRAPLFSEPAARSTLLFPKLVYVRILRMMQVWLRNETRQSEKNKEV